MKKHYIQEDTRTSTQYQQYKTILLFNKKNMTGYLKLWDNYLRKYKWSKVNIGHNTNKNLIIVDIERENK